MKTKFLALMICIFSLTSCEKQLDINADPFLPQEGPPHLYLPQVIYAMAEGAMLDVRFIGRYTQQWQSTVANENYDRHGRRPLNGGLAASQTYRNHYWSIGSNLNQIESQAAKRSFGAYKGICNIIRAYSWLISTSQFGEMPLKQAWDNTRTKFDYDSQKDIYAEVQKLCDAGIADLSSPQGAVDPNFASGELLFGGDLSKWIKFAYAIKARAANHYSNKTSYSPDKVIEWVDKSFASNADDAEVKFSTSTTVLSDFFSFLGPARANFGAMRQGKTLVGMMNGTFYPQNDPRLTQYFNPSTTGSVGSLEAGKGLLAGQIIPTMYGKWIFQNNTPYPIFTYAEMQFVKAEAAFKKGDKNTAQIAFFNAVKANMSKAGVTNALADDYLAKALPKSGAELDIKNIMTQKYIALFGHPEVWSDLRRYNYDANIFMGYTPPSTLAIENNGKLVQRCLPPSFSEEDWNTDAFRANGGYDIDYHTKPLWAFGSLE